MTTLLYDAGDQAPDFLRRYLDLEMLDELVSMLKSYGELHWSAWIATDAKQLRYVRIHFVRVSSYPVAR